MELDFKQIKSVTLGAARIEQENGEFHFFRFTKQQQDLFEHRKYFFFKTFSTSGIKLCFKTDSETFSIKGYTLHGSARRYWAFELFVDNKRLDVLDNFSDTDLSQMYPKGEFLLGDFEKEWQLGAGEKLVSLYFPWSVNAVIREICLDDGSFVLPIKPDRKLLSFGDSITHGYDALYPSNKYVSLLADYLNAEEYNKGIGGDMFFPPLASLKEEFNPDYITVAYGTNDWNNCTKEAFVEMCSEFFDNLSHTYRNSKIFAISPIWRKDCDAIKKFGKFDDVSEIIKEIVSKHENIFFVSGADIMPHDENLLSDRCIHPNDDGFKVYFKNLAHIISST